MYFAVVQDYQGVWSVSTFGGKTASQEKYFALTCNKACALVTKDIAKAQKLANERRRANQHA